MGLCSAGGVGFCSMRGEAFFSTGPEGGPCRIGGVGLCSIGGLGLDSIICERMVDSAAMGVGAGPAGKNGPMRKAVRTLPIISPMSLRMACLAEICCESGSRIIGGETLNPKIEIRNPKQIRNPGRNSKLETRNPRQIRISKKTLLETRHEQSAARLFHDSTVLNLLLLNI